MRLVLVWIVAIFALMAKDITPIDSIEINGTAKDLSLHGDILDIATDMGHIEVYDIKNKQKIKEISIPNVKDFMGDIIPARVMSSDFISDRYLLLSDSGVGGYSNLFIYENDKITQLLTPEDKDAIIKARFIDKDHILFGFLSNEVALYDIKNKKEIYRTQLSESKFSDFALNEDKTKAVFSCESGVLNIVDTHSGKVIKELKGQNVDNVYKVDFRKNIVSAAGQDRRAVIYNVDTGSGSYIQGNFLIYATGLSPSAKLVAFAMNEQNDIMIYDTYSKSLKYTLKGQKSTLNSIVFATEEKIYSASDDSSVMIWQLNK
jgi:hypothetical protein